MIPRQGATRRREGHRERRPTLVPAARTEPGVGLLEAQGSDTEYGPFPLATLCLADDHRCSITPLLSPPLSSVFQQSHVSGPLEVVERAPFLENVLWGRGAGFASAPPASSPGYINIPSVPNLVPVVKITFRSSNSDSFRLPDTWETRRVLC